MRYIFLTLLVVNLGYLALQQIPSSRSVGVQLTPAQSLGEVTIRLTREELKDVERTRQLNRVVNNPIVSEILDSPLCPAFGPLADLFRGQNLVERLKSLKFDVVLRAVDRPSDENDYRVLIPPLKTLQDAFRKLRELQSLEIDSHVITQGQDALGISLGLYASLANADAARAGFVEEGYEAEVRAIRRITREYWVYAPESKVELVIDFSLWTSILIDFPEITQKIRICSENNALDV